MSREYTAEINLRTPRARSRRLREAGVAGQAVKISAADYINPDYYLKLTGGALTGPLMGLSAEFDSVTARDGFLIVSGNYKIALERDAGGNLRIQPWNEGVAWLNTILNNNGGNVGVGTGNPSTKLDVQGIITSHAYQAVGNNAPSFIFDKNGSYMTGIGSCNTTDTIYFGACHADGTWADHTQHWKFGGNIIANGSVAARTTFSSGSDIRWKKDISYLNDDSLEVINALNPCEWEWKEGHGEGRCSGLIAQEVAKVLPYAVQGNEEDGYTLNYNCFHAFEIRALQSLDARIMRLETENRELKDELKRLMA